MSYLSDHLRKFDDLEYYLKNKDQLLKVANGGNCILFSYQPNEETTYIKKAKELYSSNAEFIDISLLLVRYLSNFEWTDFKDYYDDFKTTPHKIFKSDDKSDDLFDLIIGAIKNADLNNKIPMLVRTGALYGTGIENVNLMEHITVTKLSSPLVIYYPSKVEENNLLFLNFKPASKYRCILIK